MTYCFHGTTGTTITAARAAGGESTSLPPTRNGCSAGPCPKWLTCVNFLKGESLIDFDLLEQRVV